MTKQESIDKALEIKKESLNKKTALYEAETAALALKNPEYAEISAALSSAGAKLALTAIGGTHDKLLQLKAELQNLSERKRAILKESGIKEIEYECKICEDTGYKNGKICECVETISKSLLVKDFSANTPIYKNTLGNFDLSYYEEGKTRERMSDILFTAKKFANEFSKDTSQNFMFLGNTGLGKTHLSLGIAGEVISKGYEVVYGSAYNLFSQMEAEHFSLHTNEKYETAVNCDLLVIDDLGGEFISPYTRALLYNIINTRLLNSKSTVINSNLSLSEIEENYTPRVASRIIGEYTVKKFTGKDIRQIKAGLIK